MIKGKKGRTPSRVRYEQNHPTVSYRITKDLLDRLKAVREAEGKSITDVLRIGVGLLEVKISKEREAKMQGHLKGFAEGYKKAESLYKVAYPCRVCREILAITTPEEKEAAGTYMWQNGWGHADCIDRSY